MPRVPIAVGTDCSGMEAPIQAIRNMGVPYKHVFSCDIDRYARATIKANFPHGIMYEDVCSRDNVTAPYCDIYVAGFPCQPFSTAGLQQGFSDVRGRGTIFFEVRDYIKTQQPKVFILENVSGLKHINKGQYFAAILESLAQLGKWNISYQIMNTSEHGVPHNRKRIYIVGIRKDVDNGSFEFPEPIPVPKLEQFLDKRSKHDKIDGNFPPASQTTALRNVKTAIRELKREGSDPLEDPYVVDCDSSSYRFSWKLNISPCITVGRKSGHWVTNRGRRLRKTEMMRLQGMDPTLFKVAVPETQLGAQLGNTMSVNVLERLFSRLLPACGLAKHVPDRWASGEAVRALASTRGHDFGSALSRSASSDEDTPKHLKRKSPEKSEKPDSARRLLRRKSSEKAAAAMPGSCRRSLKRNLSDDAVTRFEKRVCCAVA